jgi:hypothetical protein
LCEGKRRQHDQVQRLDKCRPRRRPIHGPAGGVAFSPQEHQFHDEEIETAAPLSINQPESAGIVPVLSGKTIKIVGSFAAPSPPNEKAR